MGGRGSRSGIKSYTYGMVYRSFLQVDNIKFIYKNKGSTTAPFETRTDGRIYATYNNRDQLKSITLYDKNGVKKIEIHPKVDGRKDLKFGHIHYGADHGREKPLPKKYRKLLHKVMYERRKYNEGLKK